MATIEDILAVAKNKDNQILSAKSKLAKSAPSLPKATPKLPKVLPRYSKAGEETTQALSLANPLNRAENQATLRVLPKAIATGGLKGIESLIKAPAYGVAGLMTSEGDSKRYEESNKYVPKPSTLSPQTLAKAQSIADATKNFNLYPQKVQNFISGTENTIANFKTPGNRVLASTLQAGGQMAPAILSGGLGGVGVGYGVLGSGVYSSSIEESLKRGNDVKSSAGYALGQTAIELGTESLAGGIPGLGKGLMGHINKAIASKKAIGVIGEGFEEVLATYLSPIVERGTIDPNADDATLAQLAESFVSGALLSTVLQGGSIVLSSGKNISKPEDVQTLNPVEKQEFDSILEQKAYESNVRKGKITPQGETIKAYSNNAFADEFGLPAPKPTVYHGTSAEFDKFDKSKQGENWRSSKGGFFFTNSEKSAGNYAKLDAMATGGKERVIAAQLDIKKPLTVKGKYEDAFDFYDLHAGELLQDARVKGNDGIIIRSIDGKRDLYVAFEPSQINPTVQTINTNDIYSQAKGQREMPRAMFPGELPRVLPRAPQAPVMPVQASKVNVGAKLPMANKQMLPRAQGKLGDMLDTAYTQGVDSQYALGKATKRLPMAADKDIKILGSNARNVKGTTEYVFRNHLVDMEGKKINDTGLENILNVSKFEQDAYNDYLLHKHNIDRHRQGKPIFAGNGNQPTVTSEMSKKIVADYESRYPEFTSKSAELADFNNKVIDEWTVKSGLISKEFGEWLKKTYGNYVPTIRLGGVAGEQYQSRGLKANSGIKQAIGGNKPIMPIVQSYPIMVQKVMKAARQNELYNALLETVQQYPEQMSKWARVVEGGGNKTILDADLMKTSTQSIEENGLDAVSELADKMLEIDTRNGKYFVTAMKDGKPIRMEVDKKIFDSFKELGKNGAEGTLDGMAAFIRKGITNPFKALITGYNPFFALRNIARDIPTSYVFGTENNPVKWFSNLLKATRSAVTKDATFQEYEALGGKKTGFFNAEKGLRPQGLPKRILRKAGDKIQAFNELTETVPRLGEYIGTVKREGGDYAAKQKGIYNAGEVTVNFNKSGPMTKSIDAFVPYLNPGVQGIFKSLQALQKGSTWAKGLGVITVPSMILYAINNLNEDDKKNYDQLDNRTKDTYFVIPTGDGKYIKVPKSRELGVIFGTFFERLTRLATGDKEAFKDFGQTVGTNFAPANVIDNNIATPLMLNIKTNKDFAGRPIVPMSMSKDGYGDARSKYLQYDETTSEIAKWFGEATKNAGINNGEGFSPKVVQYLIDSYTGIVGDILLPATTKNGKVFEKVLTRPFTADVVYNNSIQNDFYEKYDDAKKEKSDKNILEDIPSDWVTPEDKRVSVYTKASIEMSELRKKEKQITAEMKDGKVKEDALRNVRRQILDIASKTPKEAERVYEEYKKGYIPEISMMSDKQIEAYKTIAKNMGVTPKQYYNAYQAQKDYSTDVGKALSLYNTGYSNLTGVFMVSPESARIAKALNTMGIGDAYNNTYLKLKGVSGSEEKKKIIDAANYNLPYEQIIILYEAFDISQGVGRYRRQFN